MNTIIIGLDLSLSCTGITIMEFNDELKAKSVEFHRLIYNENVSGKGFNKYKEIKDTRYILPTNISVEQLVLNSNNNNNIEQLNGSLKSMICSKKIFNILKEYFDNNISNIKNIIISIENYIMPSFGGQNQLKIVGSLIALQSYIRSDLIKFGIEFLKLNQENNFKLVTPTASENKKIFTGHGNADKLKMVNTFIDKYKGSMLIKNFSIKDVLKLNDIVDSFSLVTYAYKQLLNNKL